MKIYALWHEGQGGGVPWLVGAVDENTVRSLFESHEVKGSIVGAVR